MIRLTLILVAAVAAGLTLPATAAAAPRAIDSYCSPSGDYCQTALLHRGMLKLEMRQFPLRGPYAICVKPPRAERVCELFRWRRFGPLLASRVTAARHFPLAQRGRYRVAWYSFASRRPFRVGRVLQFRKGGRDAGAELSLASPSMSRAAPAVLATRQRGVVEVAGIRAGPLGRGHQVMPAEMVERFGPPRSVRRPFSETCLARWPGFQASFTTFGLPGPCRDRPLQALTITGRHWIVRVGAREYRVGDPRRVIPRRSRRRPHFGFPLARMRFIGRWTPTVGALVGGRNRIRGFNVFIGAAGD